MCKLLFYSLLLATLAGSPLASQAQDDTAPTAYYVSPDANGVDQVYQQLLDGSEGGARQITRAESDVQAFGAADDGLSIAYISGGQLWLQPIHTETAEPLAEIGSERFFSPPVYSPDGRYLAYADDGAWLLDLGTRETRQILDDVPVAPDGSNMDRMRLYRPTRFVVDENGEAQKLVLDIGVWEWQTAGVYDLATAELQVLAAGTQLHTDLLPLADGRVLLFGNTAVSGEFALHLADSLDDINRYQQVLSFADLTDATLFASQAAEIAPGVVRVFGQSIRPPTADVTVFNFDYDVNSGQASDVHFSTLPASTTGSSVEGPMSPDGAYAPIYVEALYDDQGGIFGGVFLLDLLTGAPLDAAFPDVVGAFGWQR